MKKFITTENKQKIREFAKQLEPLYELFDWDWASIESDDMDHKYPKADDIERTIIRLLKDLEKGPDGYISTGGLKVEYDEEDVIIISWSKNKEIYIYD